MRVARADLSNLGRRPLHALWRRHAQTDWGCLEICGTGAGRVLIATFDQAEPIRTACPVQFLAWPGWRHLLYAWTLALANGLWFLLVYGGCDFITGHRVLRIPVH